MMGKSKKAPRSRKPKAFTEDPLWYKDAVIYQVHVKSFFDSNNDGIGDFPGLIEKLDYIAELGVNTIWLLPFFPSPRRDDGYDIAEYRDVHPDYGDMADAKRFIAEAHARGLRVICELVINHTSDQHPWFQRARRAKKGSSARDFYVWSDSDQKYDGTRIIFLDTEKSNWTWDPVAGQYFWHRFYSHQPDLNFDNPQVMKAVISIMRFWLDLGIDGLRLDAIPYLIERDGTNNENLPETHDVLKRIRAEIDANYPDRMLLAEANQWPEDTQLYFGGKEVEGKGIVGDECHMAFHFPLMPRMYMAIAQEDRFPITDILRQTPDIPSNCQWAIFLRNHDELTLEMVTDKERDYLWNFYAADRRARINLGIRRRLAPLVERDRRRIELLNSLLLSMPGTPTLYYGDEIGMGDNIFLGDRDGVRTPMQWSVDRNGGFSRADTASLVLPPIMDPLYGFQAVNVEAQSRDPHSLLNWNRRMLAVRKQQKAFGRGTLKMLSPTNRRILAYLRDYSAEGTRETVLCVANLSRAAQAVELDLSAYEGKVPVEMVGGSAFPPIGQLTYLLTLPPYGFYWFLLADASQMPSWHVSPVDRMPDLPTLVLKRGLQDLLEPVPRHVLEHDSLPAYLPKRRWFSGTASGQVKVAYALPFGEGRRPLLLSEVEVQRGEGTERYQLPFGFVAEDEPNSALPQQLALARVRRGRQVGLMTDAFVLEDFVRSVVKQLRKGDVLNLEDGELHFLPSAKLQEYDLPDTADIRYLSVEQSNSSAIIGDRMVLKLIRRVFPGVHPELEVGGFLTERGFGHIAPVLGEVRRMDTDGETYALMILQGYLSNQGDAWQWTLGTLERAIRDQLSAGVSSQENQFTALGELQAFSAMLGQRLGEMHVALASETDNPDFGIESSEQADVDHWASAIRAQVEQALEAVAGQQAHLSEDERNALATLQGQRERLLGYVDELARRSAGGIRMRVHGDLHLGQVLVVQGDAYLIDFEGEPARPLAERRAKHSPLKDVTGVLRSIDYAAAMALRNAHSTDTSPEATQARQLISQTYRRDARQAFLDAYRMAAADLPHAWHERDGEGAALALFSLEKAAYEIVYEAAHRPTWIGVPLQGLMELLQHLSGAKH